MLIVKSKRYIKKHVVGGAGMFDTITGFIKRAAASEIGKNAINAAKTVGKELASSAISTAKDIAIERGKQFIESKKTTAKPVITLTQKSKDILANLLARNRLLAGQGLNTDKTNKANAVRIQDLVRKLNGGGLRLAA